MAVLHPQRIAEQEFDLTAGATLPQPAPAQPRRDDPGVVHHQQVPRPQQLRQVADRPVLRLALLPRQHEEPRRIPLREGLLRYQLRRQLIIELPDIHISPSITPKGIGGHERMGGGQAGGWLGGRRERGR